jgi:hypothetical protein
VLGFGYLALLALVTILFPSYVHRYRLTVEIEADGKLHEGSGVVEVSVNSHGPLEGLISGAFDLTMQGRAALVDIAPHGVILAVLSPHPIQASFVPRPVDGLHLAFIGYSGPNPQSDALERGRTIRYETGIKFIPEDKYPAFVWMSDPKDRGSAIPILARDMPAVIDPSVRVKSVSVEMTSDPFSDELFQKLPWLQAAWDEERGKLVVQRPKHFQLFVRNLMGYN